MRLRPFGDYDFHIVSRANLEGIKHDIESLDNDYVLTASTTEIEDHYIALGTIDPLRLHTDEWYISEKAGTSVDVTGDFQRITLPGEQTFVSGTSLSISVPYEGDSNLWKTRASHFSSGGYPEIEIRETEIVLTVTFPDDAVDQNELRSRISMDVQSLADAVANLSRDVDQHNASVPEAVRSAITRKREKALSVKNAVASLGIPMKRRGEPSTFVAPVKRKKLPVSKPSAPGSPFEPEPTLDEADCEHILGVMRSMSLVIERNPSSFGSLGEESIRDHFLIQLNGHYEGSATGETFNAAGKTDILIRVRDRNIFIAECKFWRGPKSFTDAIDQLLGYLTWRDSKCALLVFLRDGSPTAVLQKMHEIMLSRSEHRRTIAHDPERDSRYVFVKESDPGRELIITTQLYNVPAAAKD